MPNEGVYGCRKITLEEAKKIYRTFGFGPDDRIDPNDLNQPTFISAIGHQGTADAFQALGFTEVRTNRIQAQMQNGDKAIALKLRSRIEEGKILNLEEMEKIGYDLYLIECFDIHSTEVHATYNGYWTTLVDLNTLPH